MIQDLFHFTKFNENMPARVPAVFYNFEKYRFKMSVTTYRLFLVVLQCCDFINKFANEDYISNTSKEKFFILDKKVLYKYLGLENTNQRFKLLCDSIKELISCPLEEIDPYQEIGCIRSIVTDVEIEESCCAFYINPRSFEICVNTNQYLQAYPRYYLKLKTYYENWFYNFYKLVGFDRKLHIVSLANLKYQLYLENHSTYNKYCNSNSLFLKLIVGISKPTNWTFEGENSKPWNCSVDSKGRVFGALHSINEYSDILVQVFPMYENGDIVSISFRVTDNPKTKKEIKAIEIDNKILESQFKTKDVPKHCGLRAINGKQYYKYSKLELRKYAQSLGLSGAIELKDRFDMLELADFKDYYFSPTILVKE